MEGNHFILKKAFIYPKRTPVRNPEDCEYLSKFGAWFRNFEGRKIVLMRSSDPDKPEPRTKKADIETGEDLKGE